MTRNKKCKEIVEKIHQIFSECDEYSLDDKYWIANKLFEFFAQPKIAYMKDGLEEIHEKAAEGKFKDMYQFVVCENTVDLVNNYFDMGYDTASEISMWKPEDVI